MYQPINPFSTQSAHAMHGLRLTILVSCVCKGENQFLKKLYEQDEEDEEMEEEEEYEEEYEEEDRELDFKNVFRLNGLWRHKTRICLEDVISKFDEYRSRRKDQKDQQQAKPTKGRKGKKKDENIASADKYDPEDCDVLHNFLEKVGFPCPRCCDMRLFIWPKTFDNQNLQIICIWRTEYL